MIRGYGKKQKTVRKDKRTPIPFQRVSAEIKLDSDQHIVEARVMLNDLTPNGVGCFINENIDKGELLSLVIEQPKHLFVKGEVVWCTPYTLETKIISQEQFKYRLGIKFIFDGPDEAKVLKKYCEELYANLK